MKKMLSLIRVSFNHDMNIFKVNIKKQSKGSKYIIPLVLASYIMMMIGGYAAGAITALKPMHQEIACLAIFAISISLLSLIEGIYKISSLLFNCKDDNLLLSLPIKRRSVFLIRVFKFYVFELIYNSLFLFPVVVIYAINVNVSWTYYLVSFFALILLPIIPIIVSCVIGSVVTKVSSRFKGKNILQTIVTFVFVFAVMYISFTSSSITQDIGEKIANLSNSITQYYYPVNEYISLVNNFNVINFIIYILIHVIICLLVLFILGNAYFNINSSSKKVIIKHSNKKYKVKANSKLVAFVKKEISKFVSTPVYITNAGFGLVLYIVVCILVVFNFDSIVKTLTTGDNSIPIETLNKYMPVIVLALISFISFTTSITSSMISLEGKSFSILKSLPVKSSSIVLYKVITALVIMIPFILIGDIILFIRLRLDIISILLLVIASFILPFISELVGIMVNLKYPKMDATNDTEVVKQSMSSFVSVMIGFGFIGISSLVLFALSAIGLNVYVVLSIYLILFLIVAYLLWTLLKKKSDKMFNNIEA